MKNELRHIAIVMDGNRTWATAKGLPKLVGHTEGAKNVRTIAIAATEFNIPYLTLWALSTENFKKRSEKELEHLFSLANKILNHLNDFKEYNVRFNTIGDLTKLPERTQEVMQELKDKTKDHTGTVLTLAINYGGRDEMIRAIHKVIDSDVSSDELTEESFEKYLDTADMPNVDLMIRTSDHQRFSGYMLWQASYAELYFPKVKWPAFSKDDLKKAVDWYHEQKRTGGGDKIVKTV